MYICIYMVDSLVTRNRCICLCVCILKYLHVCMYVGMNVYIHTFKCT